MTKFVKCMALAWALFGFAVGTAFADERIDPEAGLDCLETLLSVNPKEMDLNVLAKLLKARDIDGLDRNDQSDIERIVVLGVWGVGKFGVYDSSIKPRLKYINGDSLNTNCRKRCDNCNSGAITKQCAACRGSGRCKDCDGSGHRDEHFNGRYLPCLSCKKSGRCKWCDGRGNVRIKCEVCGGNGTVFDQSRVYEQMLQSMKSLFQSLCRKLDAAEMGDVLKKDYLAAKDTGEEIFGIKEIRERQEAEARAREARERAEREAREREEAFEREQREKGLVKFGGKWLPREEVERIKARAPEDVKRVVTLHLEENKKGNYGAQYFCDPNLATKLFAPTGWEIVDVNIYDGMAMVTVRVDSSQKGGSRITKLWDYRLRRMGDDWKISTLTERD